MHVAVVRGWLCFHTFQLSSYVCSTGPEAMDVVRVEYLRLRQSEAPPQGEV